VPLFFLSLFFSLLGRSGGWKLRVLVLTSRSNRVTPWAVNLGYQNAFILGAFLGLAHNLTIFPVIKWGRALRQRTAARYWAKVEEMPGHH
jgi:hypothetical protein